MSLVVKTTGYTTQPLSGFREVCRMLVSMIIVTGVVLLITLIVTYGVRGRTSDYKFICQLFFTIKLICHAKLI